MDGILPHRLVRTVVSRPLSTPTAVRSCPLQITKHPGLTEDATYRVDFLSDGAASMWVGEKKVSVLNRTVELPHGTETLLVS
jgi:hypothetical protein